MFVVLFLVIDLLARISRLRSLGAVVVLISLLLFVFLQQQPPLFNLVTSPSPVFQYCPCLPLVQTSLICKLRSPGVKPTLPLVINLQIGITMHPKGKGKKKAPAKSNDFVQDSSSDDDIAGPSNRTAATPRTPRAALKTPSSNPGLRLRVEPVTPSRARAPPGPPDDYPESTNDTVTPRARCFHATVPMCLRCSKRVYANRLDIECARKNIMMKCFYCQHGHAACLRVRVAKSPPSVRLAYSSLDPLLCRPQVQSSHGCPPQIRRF